MNAITSGPRIRPFVVLCVLMLVVVPLLKATSSLAQVLEEDSGPGIRVHRGLSADTEFQAATSIGPEVQSTQTNSQPEVATRQSPSLTDCQGVPVHRAGVRSGSRIKTHRAGTWSPQDRHNVPVHRTRESSGQKIKTHRAGKQSGSLIKTHRAGSSSGGQLRTHRAGSRSRTCFK